jgi:tetratricopeptide (TPR) repeat protein
MQQLVPWLKIALTELQYWLVGMTPEGYHLRQSRNYDQLGSAKRCAHHCEELLKYAEYAEPRARLGYYYASLGQNEQAAEHYRKAAQSWPHPSILLGLAQVELRVGRYEAAVEMLARVETLKHEDDLHEAIAELRSELAASQSK